MSGDLEEVRKLARNVPRGNISGEGAAPAKALSQEHRSPMPGSATSPGCRERREQEEELRGFPGPGH